MNTKAKDLDFEVNLLPVLSVLSICICFLLTTAIWSRMGYIGINQAIGDQMPSSSKNPDSVFMKVKTNGQLLLQWKSGEDSSLLSESTVQPAAGHQFNWSKAKSEIAKLVAKSKTSTVIVMPEIGVNYGETIRALDVLKGLSLQIGLAPAIKGDLK
ncbi:MAG: putative adventurous gliding motility protein [Pseudomonadota bacterium]|jgi:biopolymer transport protein ExbD